MAAHLHSFFPQPTPRAHKRQHVCIHFSRSSRPARIKGSMPAFIFPAAAAPRATVYTGAAAASHQKNPPFLFSARMFIFSSQKSRKNS